MNDNGGAIPAVVMFIVITLRVTLQCALLDAHEKFWLTVK